MTTVSGNNIKENLITVLPDIYSAFQNNPDDLFSMRMDALKRLKTVPFPDRKNEDWRYTPVSFLPEKLTCPLSGTSEEYKYSGAEWVQRPGISGYLVNGVHLSYGPSDPNICFSSLHKAWKKDTLLLQRYFNKIIRLKNSFFGLLNTAGWFNGIFISMNGIIHDPVHLHVITEGDGILTQPRLFIHAGINTRAEIFISIHSPSGQNRFTNCLAETVIEEGGELSLNIIRSSADPCGVIFNNTIHQAEGSRFRQVTVNLNGAWSRFETRILVAGQNCSSALYGLFMPSDGQFTGHHTRIDHLVPGSESKELYKGVIVGQGKAVFNGKVCVHPGAQKTNAYQSNKNILLSDEGTVYSKPELEIYADDVKCSHGSATGYLNDDELFYLRSRGIPGDVAKKILVTAFASEIISMVADENMRSSLENILNSKL